MSIELQERLGVCAQKLARVVENGFHRNQAARLDVALIEGLVDALVAVSRPVEQSPLPDDAALVVEERLGLVPTLAELRELRLREKLAAAEERGRRLVSRAPAPVVKASAGRVVKRPDPVELVVRGE